MKIGFNKKTLLLVWDILMVYVLIRAFAIFLGYWLLTKPFDINELTGAVLISIAGVGFFAMHSICDENEPTTP